MRHALMVAGTRSGSGKTTLTLCLLAALAKRGLNVQACKSGPDFIDPTHHAALTGRPSYNLDSWMGGQDAALERVTARMLREARAADMLLTEGAMGLFDGAHGVGGPGSSAHLARLLRIPVLLVIDVRGMGQSAAALAAGYVRQQKDLHFAGLVCSHVGSKAHADMLREAFAQVFPPHTGPKGGPHAGPDEGLNAESDSPPLLGILPREGLPELPSRHLGLVMAHEKSWDAPTLAAMAQWAEEHIDLDALLLRCPPPEQCAAVQLQSIITPNRDTKTPRPRIGIAKDAAFCFLYPDMPAVLEELGAECVFFSPLEDTELPPHCSALYFPGGYPELHVRPLAANAPMLEAVRRFAAQKRVYAECGGYIYLCQNLEVEGHSHALCGCLPLTARLGAQKAALGYRSVRMVCGSPGCELGIEARGHEFHYASLLQEPALPPLWQAQDRKGQPCPSAFGVRHGHICASWVHLYPEGSRTMLAHIFNLTAHTV